MAALPDDIGPVAGWDDGPVDDDVRAEVEEFARWIKYLLNPQLHDGPRRYVCLGAAEGGCGHDCGFSFPMGRKMRPEELAVVGHPPDKEGDPYGYQVYSTAWDFQPVLHPFDDVPALFHAVHAFCGIRWRNLDGYDTGSMEATFRNLSDGQLCNPEAKQDGNSGKSELYKRDQSFYDLRDKLLACEGIAPTDPRYDQLLSYRQTILKDAERNENQAFQLADALGRYRGAYLGARDKVVGRMKLLNDAFAADGYPDGYEQPLNGFLISSVIGAFFTIAGIAITGPAGAVAYGVITNAIGGLITGLITQDQAGESPEPDQVRPPPFSLDSRVYLDLVNWFVEEVNAIGDDAFNALDTGNGNSLSHLAEGKLQQINDEIAAQPLEVPPR